MLTQTERGSFSLRNYPDCPLAYSLRTEEIVHLQITTPRAGLHLVASDLETLRYWSPIAVLPPFTPFLR